MFYISYIASELRRRKGRTLLTALGLAVGVGLVVAVSALSAGLDDAQDEVLEPLTGVGTDISVTRPIDAKGGFESLSKRERRQLQDENGDARIGLTNQGDPGDKFTTTSFLATTQLSFPASEVDEVASLDGVKSVAAGLTLNATTVSGTVPEDGGQDQPGVPSGGGGPPDNIDFKSTSVSGVDQAQKSLGAISAAQVSKGNWFSQGDSREAIVNTSYANRQGIEVGDTVMVKGKRLKVVGLATSPLGGQASDIYMKLDQLQQLADRKDRVNTLYVRADSADAVGAVSREIEQTFASSEVTDAQDLADRVGGSLQDAKDLAGKLGTALTIVALLAAFLIASLLTLSSVTKRTRELGTLKAIGWPQRKVVRQVTGEALAQGALGGVLGAAIGVGAAALITAVGPELKATVAEATQASGPGGGPPPGGGFGQGAVQAGSELIKLTAPVDAPLLLLAIGLALLGGLVAGSVGGLRAARLRPADALRHID
ncbi:MAG: ABC transporter permease [Thermoleophilaceae bacterium]|nr:ABC transporter permease [Thermoleophilaceae bacterium]